MDTSNYGLILQEDELVVTRTPRPGFFDPRFLVAALLEHVARGDGSVCEHETAVMIDQVARHFGLDAGCAERRFADALSLYSRSLDLARVGEVLQEVLAPAERVQVVVMLLEVIAADGRRGADELAALDQVVASLGISAGERHAAFERYFRYSDSFGDSWRIQLD